MCGGAGSSNDRFTLRFHRRKLSSSSRRAARRTCSFCSTRRGCRRPWRSWTRTRVARSTPTSGASRGVLHLVSRRSSDVVSRAGRRPSTGASRSASSSSRPSRSGGRGPRPRPTANSPRSSSTRPASASGSSTGTGAGRSRRLRSCAPCVRTRSRTRRPTTARISTCDDSVICGGTAVFVCLVCGGAESDDSSNYEHTHEKEQPNDRFTLRAVRRT